MMIDSCKNNICLPKRDREAHTENTHDIAEVIIMEKGKQEISVYWCIYRSCGFLFNEKKNRVEKGKEKHW